ncbi:MAG: hypothetical protein P857_1006 [Candidatus Xenolissoclinum pacificiensis L6]|uniref:Uncharacterized protein n=1 Tax=Candidatus Xenolissoclinum pacificiensis L6 TaxID=1401685 RepID=W2V300_9RICK|nr:MAG: hypothetical protein P857_1006 [Candidatus Xenolissoclinum pacificiensis L6]
MFLYTVSRILLLILCVFFSSYNYAKYPNSLYFVENENEDTDDRKCGHGDHYRGVIIVVPDDMKPNSYGEYSVAAHFNPYVYINYHGDNKKTCTRYSRKLYEGERFSLPVWGNDLEVRRSRCNKDTYFDSRFIVGYPDYDFIGEWTYSDGWWDENAGAGSPWSHHWDNYRAPYPECFQCSMRHKIGDLYHVGSRKNKAECEEYCMKPYFTEKEDLVDCLCVYRRNVKDSRRWGFVYPHKPTGNACIPIPPLPSVPPLCNTFDQVIDIQIVPIKEASMVKPEMKIIFNDGSIKEEHVLSMTDQDTSKKFSLSFQSKTYFFIMERQVKYLCTKYFRDAGYNDKVKENCYNIVSLPRPESLRIVGSASQNDEGISFKMNGLNNDQEIIIMNEEFNQEYELEVITPEIDSSGFLIEQGKCINNGILIDPVNSNCPSGSDGVFTSYKKDNISKFICLNGWNSEPPISFIRYKDSNDNKIKTTTLEMLDQGFIPVSYNQEENKWYVDYSTGRSHYTIQSLDQNNLDSVQNVGLLSNIFTMNVGGKVDYYRYSQINLYKKITEAEKSIYPEYEEVDSVTALRMGVKNDGSNEYILVKTPFYNNTTGEPYAISYTCDANTEECTPDVEINRADPIAIGICITRPEFYGQTNNVNGGQTETIKDPMCAVMQINIFGAAESSGPWYGSSSCSATSGAPGYFFSGELDLTSFSDPELKIDVGKGGDFDAANNIAGFGTHTTVEVCDQGVCNTVVVVEPASTTKITSTGFGTVDFTSNLFSNVEVRNKQTGYCYNGSINPDSIGFIEMDNNTTTGKDNIYGNVPFNVTGCNDPNSIVSTLPSNSCIYPRSEQWCSRYCDQTKLSGLNFYQCFGKDGNGGACGHLSPPTVLMRTENNYCGSDTCFEKCFKSRVNPETQNLKSHSINICQGAQHPFCYSGNLQKYRDDIKSHVGEVNEKVMHMRDQGSHPTEMINKIIYSCFSICGYIPDGPYNYASNHGSHSCNITWIMPGRDGLCEHVFCKSPYIYKGTREFLCDACKGFYDENKEYTNENIRTGQIIVGCPEETSTYDAYNKMFISTTKNYPGTGGCYGLDINGNSVYQSGGDAYVEVTCTELKIQMNP